MCPKDSRKQTPPPATYFEFILLITSIRVLVNFSTVHSRSAFAGIGH